MAVWRKYQQKIKFRRHVRRLMVVIFIAGAPLLLLLIIKIVQWFSTPLFLKEGMQAPSLIRGQQVNFVVAGMDPETKLIRWVSVGAWDEGEKILSFLILPRDEQLTVYGTEYPISQLSKVGSALNPPRPVAAVIDSVEDYLAVPLDTFYFINDSSVGEEELSEKILSLHQTIQSPSFWLSWPFYLKSISEKGTTSLSRIQLLRVLVGCRRVSAAKLKVEQIKNYAGYENVEIRDRLVRTLLGDEQVKKENVGVSVKNGTSISGLAMLGARFVQNAGMRVVSTGNYRSFGVEATEIKVLGAAGDKIPYSLRRLSQIFGKDPQFLGTSEVQRMDVEIIIGKDWGKRAR
ncbi:hypothetical protein B5M47_03285 [candidate division CPR3 bacterium 4484_211]|uniref:LytR/CpsA/Psr regulator C-terminal domain-containing protein n=1 Tax=candidate division CPR3 bacterium 4484_211 TaxID=1968527 RepID=A0A1W9NXC9_UNCC3|nr:MAG: hypothetical protein B5M47_03285 [candidate division CPR3 bacterium 4484_211]